MARAVIDEGTPTMVVFDLDPGAPADAVDCARVALRLREILDHLDLSCVVKSSGSKGLQAYVPLNSPSVTAGATKDFALAVARLLEQRHPAEVVSTQAKDKRTGKVLVDWLQNEAFKTTVCAYSLRALDRPTVSTPLSWDEVADLADGGDPQSVMYGPIEVLDRVARHGDLFADAATLEQELPALG
jgi:bifunctional non-homologous end joining protein LigD